MNLIEQLGGYDRAKIRLDGAEQSLSYYKDLSAALLEHRRQHNIFEVGDFIVFDTSKPFCAKMQPDLMEVINPRYQEHDMIVRIDNQIYVVGGMAVRHAEPEELEAGKRLEVD